MDKNAIKKYAVWARRELIEKVSQKALQFGIEDSKELNAETDSVNGLLLSETEKKQRKALIQKINDEGFSQVIEEVAYTWFNRFIALRFMEVNGYLPSHIRVFTDENNAFKPQILSEALHVEFSGIDMDKVMEMKQNNQDEELYKYLLIMQCNDLNHIFPRMFQRLSDYTELLLPDFLLRDGSVIEQMISIIPEEDWTDQVQILGWLYQFYNIEPKNAVFGKPKNEKIKKEEIPAATQLFTPDWIVRYMVENSLLKLWMENTSDYSFADSFKYYVAGCEDNKKYMVEGAYIKVDSPENIKVLDPCMGSGHVLCYVFDVLVRIYESFGYSARDAVESIVTKNIWGLDIDERAAQLAYFAIMMKARQYDRRFLSKNIQPNVYAVKESNDLQKEIILDYADKNGVGKEVSSLLLRFNNAKEYGSLVKVSEGEFQVVEEKLRELQEDNLFSYQAKSEIEPLLDIAHVLSQKYDVVITNPPYMSGNSVDALLGKYIKDNYEAGKSDLFAVFMQRCKELTKKNGYQAMITMHSWMFLASFENLRREFSNTDLVSMIHLGARAFEEISGEIVQTTSFVYRNSNTPGIKGTYFRLVNGDSQSSKEKMFLDRLNRYDVDQRSYKNILGEPITYWISNQLLEDFSIGKMVSYYAKPRQGMSTCDVNRFTRLWHEVDINSTNLLDKKNISKWVRYNKGGNYRKWYGNREYLVFWGGDGSELIKNGALLRNKEAYFQDFIAWTKISGAGTGFRDFEDYFLFDGAGGSLFVDDDKIPKDYLLGLLNSNVCSEILDLISPTLNYNENHIGAIPILLPDEDADMDTICKLVRENVNLAKQDWDSYEVSWDFQENPLIEISNKTGKKLISDLFDEWSKECLERKQKVKANEEELNRLFNKIYNVENEVDYEVPFEKVTINLSSYEDDMKNLVSYIVGCMFGRYSIRIKGIIDLSSYDITALDCDEDNIIPITDDEYFTDDIVTRFIELIRDIFGDDSLDDNLTFIAGALGKGKNAREIIRNYFNNDFYKDHCKMYQKRPIYWQFDSGKKGGFKCLIYIHRYKNDIIARIRTDYVHELQARYRTALESAQKKVENVEGAEKVKTNKNIKRIAEQIDEIHVYEEKIHHYADMMLDLQLDDGVKNNYQKLSELLSKI